MSESSLTPACQSVSQYWDGVVRNFLQGGEVPPELQSWFDSYRGKGEGAVQPNALPELFLGSLEKPKAVFLSPNPGAVDFHFQGRDGIFAQEIQKEFGGSYTKWAASWAYLRNPWVAQKGRNRHHSARLKFLRNWFRDKTLSHNAMLAFELYPWHSARITARMNIQQMQPFIQDYIWKPIAELAIPVFAFGASWFDFLANLSDLKLVKRLGLGGEPYGSCAKTRSVIVLRDVRTKILILAAKHQGSAGPPCPKETKRLRNALSDIYS